MPTRTVRFRKSGQEVATIDFWFNSEEEFEETVRAERERLGIPKKNSSQSGATIV
jgi:hypothetical protein